MITLYLGIIIAYNYISLHAIFSTFSVIYMWALQHNVYCFSWGLHAIAHAIGLLVWNL